MKKSLFIMRETPRRFPLFFSAPLPPPCCCCNVALRCDYTRVCFLRAGPGAARESAQDEAALASPRGDARREHA
eukprot:2124987-Rhodomonas_salina.2